MRHLGTCLEVNMAVLGERLGLLILEVFSNLTNSMIL